jgi:hypothetical protein
LCKKRAGGVLLEPICEAKAIFIPSDEGGKIPIKWAATFHFSTGYFPYITTPRHLYLSGFILWAIFLCFAVRILGTIGQTFLVNWLRKGINPINWQVWAPT